MRRIFSGPWYVNVRQVLFEKGLGKCHSQAKRSLLCVRRSTRWSRPTWRPAGAPGQPRATGGRGQGGPSARRAAGAAWGRRPGSASRAPSSLSRESSIISSLFPFLQTGVSSGILSLLWIHYVLDRCFVYRCCRLKGNVGDPLKSILLRHFLVSAQQIMNEPLSSKQNYIAADNDS